MAFAHLARRRYPGRYSLHHPQSWCHRRLRLQGLLLPKCRHQYSGKDISYVATYEMPKQIQEINEIVQYARFLALLIGAK
jgi:hypothetical protein